MREGFSVSEAEESPSVMRWHHSQICMFGNLHVMDVTRRPSHTVKLVPFTRTVNSLNINCSSAWGVSGGFYFDAMARHGHSYILKTPRWLLVNVSRFYQVNKNEKMPNTPVGLCLDSGSGFVLHTRGCWGRGMCCWPSSNKPPPRLSPKPHGSKNKLCTNICSLT